MIVRAIPIPCFCPPPCICILLILIIEIFSHSANPKRTETIIFNAHLQTMPRSILVIVLLFFFGSPIVNADRVVRFMFNADKSACSDADNDKIELVFNPIARRQLRISTSTQEQRELRTATQYCINSCMYMAICHVRGCAGTRRELELEPETVERELQANLTCNEEINQIQGQLNRLINTKALSPSCMTAIGIPNREFSCFNDVIYGNIDNVRLWNLNNPASPVSLTNTMSNTVSICSNMDFTIEANANTCVDYIKFQLLGPGGYNMTNVENNKPFALFGNAGEVLFGKRLRDVGNYTLTMIPDQNQTKAKIINFRVKQC